MELSHTSELMIINALKSRIDELDIHGDNLPLSENVQRLILEGNLLRTNGKTEEALGKFKKALQLKNDASDALRGIIIVAEDIKSRGNIEEADKLVESVVCFIPNVENLNLLAQLRYSGGYNKRFRVAVHRQTGHLIQTDHEKCLVLVEFYINHEKLRLKRTMKYLEIYRKMTSVRSDKYFELAIRAAEAAGDINSARGVYSEALDSNYKSVAAECIRIFPALVAGCSKQPQPRTSKILHDGEIATRRAVDSVAARVTGMPK